MQTYLVIKDNLVINTVIWDGIAEWSPVAGTTVELAPDNVGVGWTNVDGEWIAPPLPASEPENPSKASARAKLAALGLTEEEIAALLK